MKFLFTMHLLSITLLTMITVQCSGKAIIGDWEHKVHNVARTDFAQVRFYAERYQCVKGGLSIVFPEKYFTKIPLVYVTIGMLKNPYSTALLVHAIVEKCSSASAVIRVNKEQPGFFFNDIIEAEDGEFFVNVFAIGD